MLSNADYTGSWFVLVSPAQLVSSQMVPVALHDPYMPLLHEQLVHIVIATLWFDRKNEQTISN